MGMPDRWASGSRLPMTVAVMAIIVMIATTRIWKSMGYIASLTAQIRDYLSKPRAITVSKRTAEVASLHKSQAELDRRVSRTLSQFAMPIDFATKYCEIEELRDGHLLVVRLNRPKDLNSLHTRCHMELARVFDYFDSNDSLWVAVLTGNGRAFCAGNDLRVNAGVDTDGDGETLKPYNGQPLAMPVSGFGGVVERRSV